MEKVNIEENIKEKWKEKDWVLKSSSEPLDPAEPEAFFDSSLTESIKIHLSPLGASGSQVGVSVTCNQRSFDRESPYLIIKELVDPRE